MHKFPSIEQYRHVIRAVREHVQFIGHDEDGTPRYNPMIPPPRLNVVGTVKLHGTNGGVYLKHNGELEVYSRNRVITPEDDNAGFARFVQSNAAAFSNLIGITGRVIYGEWCGEGIMNGCAIHQLEKMFVVFAAADIETDTAGGPDFLPSDEPRRVWLPITHFSPTAFEDPSIRVFNIQRGGVYHAVIDFANPEEAQNELTRFTKGVEEHCPFGLHFGVDGIGEGIVWQVDSPAFNSSRFWFKVKGNKHSVTKVKQLAEVDVEKLASVREFAEATVTVERCTQAMAYLAEQNITVDKRAIGPFLKWVVADVLKEETDRMEASGLDKKEVGAACSKVVKAWLFEQLRKRGEL